MTALKIGMPNLVGHIRNLRDVYGVNVVVAVNKFITDTDEEIKMIEDACRAEGAVCALCECWAKGGEGSVELANAVLEAIDKPSKLKYSYDLDMSIEDKIFAVASKVYGAGAVEYSDIANMYRKDAVFFLRRYDKTWQTYRIHYDGARRGDKRRSRIFGSGMRKYYAYAGTWQEA